MTEAEWQVCVRPDRMLTFLHHYRPTSDRRLWLFAASCCRRIWNLLSDERCRAAVEAVERVVDGHGQPEEREDAKAAARTVFASLRTASDRASPNAALAVLYATGGSLPGRDVPFSVANRVDQTVEAATYAVAPAGGPVRVAEYAGQSNLLRCIIGNPFLRTTAARSWLTWREGTILKLAQAIYEERAFDRLPILGDALEDAGCDNDIVLGHCRQVGEHVLGCWVVDLLLGKE
jgi:hypothetical protein